MNKKINKKRGRGTVNKKPVRAHLHELRGEAAGVADPVHDGHQAAGGQRAEGQPARAAPLLAQEVGVDVRQEDGQDHGQHRHQVHLTPVLIQTQRQINQYSFPQGVWL